MKDRWTCEMRRIARLSGLKRVDPLLFCHIPKCAGTSFRAVVEQEYRPEQRLFLYKEEELNLPEPGSGFLERFQSIRNSIQIIYGHFVFGMHRFLDVPPTYATILREPVARVVSLYHHFRRDPQSPFYSRIKEGLSIKQFSAWASNHMTRTLAGVPAVPGGPSFDERWLGQAKQNAETYFVAIGTVESMGGVLRTLGRRFGWRDHVIPNLNVQAEDHSEIDVETRHALIEHNALDIRLYEWVRARGMGRNA